MGRTRRKPMTWGEYVRWVIGDDKQVEVSVKTGIDQGTISRWLKEGDDSQVSARAARCFALGYGRPVLQAFVVAGFLTEAEAGVQPPQSVDMDGISDEQLAAEVRRRLLALAGRRTVAGHAMT